MAVSLTRLSCWLMGTKGNEPVTNGSSLNSSLDWAFREMDSMKFPSVKKGNFASSNRKVRKKWKSREERRVDKEYDVVLVPSDGVGLSGSESDDSDWSIGWLEPHAPDFQSDDEADDSFAVLVPCYKQGFKESKEMASIGFINDATMSIGNHYCGGKEYVEQCLSSLRYC